MFRYRVITAVLLIQCVGAAEAQAVSRMEMQAIWGICGQNQKIADGTIAVGDNKVTVALTLNDGEKASFSTPVGKNGRIKAEFQIGSGDGFQIEGELRGTIGRGTWKSVTLSCGGKWTAEEGKTQ